MIITRVRYQGRLVRLGGLGPQKYQMFRIGQAAVDAMKKRVAQGIGSDDAKMPPLKRGYAIAKTKRGLRNIRDLRSFGVGGNMLDYLRVTYADQRQVKIDITGAKARVKARQNEQRAAWFGLSGTDARTVVEAAEAILQENISQVRAQVAGLRGMTPIWMDPLGYRSARGRAAA